MKRTWLFRFLAQLALCVSFTLDPALAGITADVEIIEPDDGIIGIGSGGPVALAAARALVAHSDLDSKQTVVEALRIAAGICVYTNDHVVVEEL